MGQRVAFSNRHRRRAACAASSVAMLLGLAGCSSLGSSDSSWGGGVLNMFSGGSDSSKTPTAVAAGPQYNPDDCPVVDVRVGASTLSVPSPNVSPPTANDVRYQLSFNKLARQCIAAGGSLTIKLGVQGRIVLGPAGGPGPVSIPLRYAVVQEGIEPKTIATKFKRLSIDVPSGQGNTAFDDVDDSMNFPIPPAADLQSYVVYVGFDEAGDKPPTKPAAAPKAKTAAKKK
jgi:hypothetical protein